MTDENSSAEEIVEEVKAEEDAKTEPAAEADVEEVAEAMAD